MKIKAIIIVILIAIIVGCSFGPIHITHKKGKLPKVHVDTLDDDCKVRAKVNIHEVDYLKYQCEWTLEDINLYLLRGG